MPADLTIFAANYLVFIEAELREILDQYVDAFERADISTLAGLLRADVELEMPPTPTWFTGRDAVAGFLASRVCTNTVTGGWLPPEPMVRRHLRPGADERTAAMRHTACTC
jgi:plasmid stability protein